MSLGIVLMLADGRLRGEPLPQGLQGANRELPGARAEQPGLHGDEGREEGLPARARRGAEGLPRPGEALQGGEPEHERRLRGGTSGIRFKASGGAGDITISLPCANWTTKGANTLYKYKDTSGASCKIVLVKDGVLAKAVCKGAQVAITVGAGMAPVGVVTTLNTERYCTSFGGTLKKDGSDAKTFLAKDAAAPTECASPSGAFLDASDVL